MTLFGPIFVTVIRTPVRDNPASESCSRAEESKRLGQGTATKMSLSGPATIARCNDERTKIPVEWSALSFFQAFSLGAAAASLPP